MIDFGYGAPSPYSAGSLDSTAVEMKWTPMSIGTIQVLLAPVFEASGATGSPSKSVKSVKKGGGGGGGSASANEPSPRSGGLMFSVKELLYVVGGGESGAMDCYAIPTSAPTPPPAPATSAPPSKKGSGNASLQPTTLWRSVSCSGKCPTPRRFFASCCAYTSASASNGASPLSNGPESPTIAPLSPANAAVPVLPSTPPSSAFVCGGLNASTGALDDLFELKISPLGLSWNAVVVKPPLLTKRYHHAIAHTAGKLYCFGGIDGKSNCALSDFLVLEDLGNGQGKRWLNVLPFSAPSSIQCDDDGVFDKRRPCARSHHSLVAGQQGHLYLFGGVNHNGIVLNDLWHVVVNRTSQAVDVVGTAQGAHCSVVSWRQVDVTPSLPRRFGCSVLLVPNPRGPSTAEASNSSPKSGTRPSVFSSDAAKGARLEPPGSACAVSLVVPMMSPSLIHSSTLQPNGGNSSSSFLFLICGGWDEVDMNPYRLIGRQSSVQSLGSPLLTKHQSSSMRDSSLSFALRKDGDGSMLRSGVKFGNDDLLATTAYRSDGGMQQSAENYGSFRVPRSDGQPLFGGGGSLAPDLIVNKIVLPYVISAVEGRHPADRSSGGGITMALPRASISRSKLPQPLLSSKDDLTCGDDDELESLASHSFVGGAQRHGSASTQKLEPSAGLQQPSAAEKFSKLFAHSIARATTCPLRIRPGPNDIPTVVAVQSESFRTSGHPGSLHAAFGVVSTGSSTPSPRGNSPSKAMTHVSALDATTLVPGAASTAEPAAAKYHVDFTPVSAMHSLWCRGVTGKHFYTFGGAMTPMVTRSDLWKCEVSVSIE